MAKEFLIISDSDAFRLQALQYLSIEWPNVDVDEFDPKTGTMGEAAERLSRYDAVLLDHQSAGPRGLDWLKRFKQQSDCPPVVFLTEYGNPPVNEEAVTAGADYCLSKYNLTHSMFIGAMRRAMGVHTTMAVGVHDDRPALVTTQGEPGSKLPPVVDEAIEIKGYDILMMIGRGGMSTVYLAERKKDHKQVVLKILDTIADDSDDMLQRFIEEYRMISTMQTSQVVRIYDQGFTDRHVYLVMEFLSGDLLERIMCGLTPDQALGYLRQIGQALEEIHSIGILHRDIKPQNVMFRGDDQLVLVDFGIAKQLGSGKGESSGGKPGWVYGTPGYMSPEQAAGKPVDQRCDLYNAGIVFHEMLTGNLPGSMLQRASVKGLQAPTDVPVLPSHLSEYQPVIDRLLEPDPDSRYQSASDLLDDLDRRWGPEAGAGQPALT